MYIQRFNAVTYQPLFVTISISCIAMPSLEIDKEQGYLYKLGRKLHCSFHLTN